MIDANGKLWITDRKKHIFKLSQGECTFGVAKD